ncbi:MAG TPA: ATP-binding protein [Pyrinomonadaceae bacterium]|nr:ATP-binding protein [Pyrinomonadaceae bacterium]
MRTLFLKIFFCFLVIIVLVGTSLETSSLLAKFYEERWQVTLHSIMPMEAEKAARMYETEGEDALRSYLDELQSRKTMRFYFFDENGDTLLNRPAPDVVLRLARNKEALARTTAQGLTLVNPRLGIAVKQVTGPSGRQYSLAFQTSPTYLVPLSEAVGKHPYLRLLVITLVAAGLCAVLTLHITRPLGKLRSAASDIAEGHLKTRVQPAIGRRHDEIALLGKDFDRMAEQIERLVTAQRNLLGDVSHELRSPLARLIVALSLLKQGDAEEASEYQNRISIEAERLDKLIGQLLTLTRIDSGVDQNMRETFDLASLVQEVAADGDFEARAQNRAVRFLAAESCLMSGIAEMIRSAVENVVRNAVRHTAAGTTVEITMQRENNQRALLRVRDHGPGVPAPMLDKIFLPFHRVVSVNGNGHDGGAGLGLAIADRVVKLHHGNIEAYNAREGGLVIDIHLPLQN